MTTSEMTLLMDAPPSAISLVERIPVSAPIRGILCSSGRMSSVGGLLGVLDCISGHDSDGVLPIYAPMGDDRPGLLVESWTRGWPNGVSVCLDTLFPGGSFALRSMHVETLGIQCPERTPHASRDAQMSVGMAWRVHVGHTTLLWAKSCAPQPMLSSWCKGVSLAILEVGDPHQATHSQNRAASESQLGAYGLGAEELWLVSDNGRPVDSRLLN